MEIKVVEDLVFSVAKIYVVERDCSVLEFQFFGAFVLDFMGSVNDL